MGTDDTHDNNGTGESRDSHSDEIADSTERADAERVDSLIQQWLNGEPPQNLGELDADDVALLQQGAALSAARAGALVPDPAFIQELRAKLLVTSSQHSRTDETASASGQSSLPAHAAHAADSVAEPGEPKKAVSRRNALTAAAAGIAGLAAGGLAGHAAADQAATDHTRKAVAQAQAAYQANELERLRAPYATPMVGEYGHWQTIAHDGQIAPGSGMRFQAGPLIGYLMRDQAGAYYAVSASCTHMGCLLTLLPADSTFLCPCHGATYDPAGQVISGVARHPLPRLRVRVWWQAIQVWTVGTVAHGSGVGRYSAD